MKGKLPSVAGTMRRSSLWRMGQLLWAHKSASLTGAGLLEGLTWRVTAGKVHEASGTRAHATGPFGLQRISEL